MSQTNKPEELFRGLRLIDAVAMVVGTTIGTGIFLKAAVMTQLLGSPTMVLAAWVCAGVLSLAGALTYAELGAMRPHSGGEYVYLRAAYGDLPAFLFGWMRFAVVSAGSSAAIAVGFATFLFDIFPLGGVWLSTSYDLFGREVAWEVGNKQLVAIAAIAFLTFINTFAVVVGGRLQSVLMIGKLLAVSILIIGIFAFAKHIPTAFSSIGGSATLGPVAAFGAAMMAALWAYDGWNNMAFVAGEIRDPGRNIPRALIGGMCLVIVVYLLVNTAYFYAIPTLEIAQSNSTAFADAPSVATRAASSFMGVAGAGFLAAVFVVSAFGTLNGSVLSNPRVPYAMAKDGLFFSMFAKVDPKTRVPVRAVLLQSFWASLLVLSGSFDQLTDYVMFASVMFYGLTATAVFALRKKHPDEHRPYRTLGYPVVPILFVVTMFWLVGNSLYTRPVESGVGLLLILAGLPLYYRFKRISAAAKAHVE